MHGKVIPYLNEANLRSAGLVLWRVTIHGYTISVYDPATLANSARPSHIPLCVVVMSTANGHGQW